MSRQCFCQLIQTYVQSCENTSSAGEPREVARDGFALASESFALASESFEQEGESFGLASESFEQEGESFGLTGESFEQESESFGFVSESFRVKGESFVLMGESFGVKGESFGLMSESFGVKGERHAPAGERCAQGGLKCARLNFIIGVTRQGLRALLRRSATQILSQGWCAMATDSLPQAIYIPEGYYYTQRDVAQIMGVQSNTVLYWIRKGWLPAVPAGRAGHFISRDALAQFDPKRWGPRLKTKAKE